MLSQGIPVFRHRGGHAYLGWADVDNRWLSRRTEGSNPAPSSGESTANLTFRRGGFVALSSSTSATIPGSPKPIADGKANYGVFCEGCHGEKGDGVGPIATKFGIPVANLTTPVVQQQTDGELFWKISHGRGAMPIWTDVLTSDDRWELTTQLQEAT